MSANLIKLPKGMNPQGFITERKEEVKGILIKNFIHGNTGRVMG